MTAFRSFGIVRQIAIICGIVAVISSCTTQPTRYQSLGSQVNTAPKLHQTKKDISQILGVEPILCEKIPGKPIVGILLRHDSGTTVLEVYPDSPASATGIKAGDKIISVDSKPVHSMEDVITSTEGLKGPNSSITIKTQRGSYVVTPKFPHEAEQCYWELTGDHVHNFAGSNEKDGMFHDRFFHATCRFADGKAYICRARWHE